MARSVSPGHVVVYPNREKATSKTTKLIVVLLLLASVVLVLLVTLGGWSKLQGLKPVDIAVCLIYLILAFYVGVRWSRGALTMAAALGILILLAALVAGAGLSGTSWFQRNSFGYAAPHSVFGSKVFGPDLLGLLTLLIVPLQVLLIAVSLLGFSQAWNVETEAPIEEARRRGYDVPSEPSSARPATA